MDAISAPSQVDGNILDQQLSNERLLLVAGQTKASSAFVIVVLCGFTSILYAHINVIQLVAILVIVAVYLFRVWLARKVREEINRFQCQQHWALTFKIVAALSGVLWGLAAAISMVQGYSGTELFVAFLIGGISAGAISSLGFFSRVFAFFTVGILAPISVAFIIRGDSIGPILAILTMIYAVVLLVFAQGIRNQLNRWLHLSHKKEQLVHELYAEKEISEQRLNELKHEVEEGRKAENITEQHRTTLSNLLGNLPGMAYRAVNDDRWSFEFISDGCRDILGLTADQLFEQGKSCIHEVLVSNDRRFATSQFRTMGANATFQHEYTLITPQGDERRVIERGCKVYGQTGELIAIDGFITDISDQFLLSNKLSQLEKHDSLTGVFNRQQFEVIVQNTAYKSAYDLTEHVLIYVDLDQFKIVNDTCGHTAGDEILQQIAAIFQARLRQQDAIARLGGDEFGILLGDCSIDQATKIAAKLCKAVQDFRFCHDDRNVRLTTSIGLASTSCGLKSLQQLMIAAESAARTAKENGRNQVYIYQANDDLHTRRNLEVQWAIEVPEAIQEDRMYLEQQKIVPIDSLTPAENWCELLIRMRDRVDQTIMPGAFLPVAEQYHQAILIDTWVVKTLLTLLEQRPEDFDDIDQFFINLSGQTMGQQAFLDNIFEMLKTNRRSASRICFEITETAAVANKKMALSMMTGLRQLGCRFALGDFGSGLSSFGYLRDFPVDYIKIDGEFVKDIAADPVSRSIVASICDIGHATGKKLIAEFVENEEILQVLGEIGVDYAQGFGICKPVSLFARRKPKIERSA